MYVQNVKDGLPAQWGTPAKMDFPELILPKKQ